MLLRQKITISCDITERLVSNALKNSETRIILARILNLQISSRLKVRTVFVSHLILTNKVTRDPYCYNYGKTGVTTNVVN